MNQDKLIAEWLDLCIGTAIEAGISPDQIRKAVDSMAFDLAIDLNSYRKKDK